MSVSNIGTFLQSAAVSFGSSQGSAIDSLGSAISQAEANLGKGLASIANSEALTRTNNQISQIIQNVLDGTNGTSSSSSTSSSTGKATPAKAATGTGTKSVSVGTPLSTLGVLKGGSIYVSAGGNTTAYTSTGSDTVGDLLSTINSQLPNNAQVSASLNSRGDIVLTSRNTKDTVSVSGVFASNIGFAVGNETFKPTAAVTPKPTASTSSSTSSSKKTSTSNTSLQTALSTNAGSAASVLAASGAAGSLVNMLA
jgi:hypothetical protein